MVNQSLFYVLRIFAYLHLIRDLFITTVIDAKLLSKPDLWIVISVQSYIMISVFGLLRAISGLKYVGEAFQFVRRRIKNYFTISECFPIPLADHD